ncbi:MAG TPA: hypothetical protein VFL55_20480 [Acetobacteraceae bacterium]|jgi:hypothetical protein|nr:hypothetical protein [Acetobacteraceae bacterium]
MQTLVLTMPELERAARQWTAEFLHQEQATTAVVTNLRQMQTNHCDDQNIILFGRAPTAVLTRVLQQGGRPWLVTDLVMHDPAIRY